MKFLFWLNIGFDRGGPSVHLLQDVIRHALRDGHAVKLILKDTGGSMDKVPLEFVEYEKFSYTLVPNVVTKKTNFFHRYIAEILYARKCKRAFKNNKYDVVFLQSCNAAAFYVKSLRCLKCPIVFNVQDIFPQNLLFSSQLPMEKISYPILNALQKYAYGRVAKIITISDDMKDTLVDQGVDEDKIEVVYNWSYEDSEILLEKISEKNIFNLNMDPDKINVVYAGNIGKMQNVEIIARAARLSKNDESIHYYIIGDGANKIRVSEIVDGLHNVTVLPMQPAIYAESIYAQADINVIPLAKGGIKTALPSKTATIMRTDTKIVFCIEPHSKFGQIVNMDRRVRIADNDNPRSLYSVICDLRDENVADAKRKRGILPLFSKKNCERYVEIMKSARG